MVDEFTIPVLDQRSKTLKGVWFATYIENTFTGEVDMRSLTFLRLILAEYGA